MDRNYFATRDQYVFICYKDIIKLNYAVMMKILIEDYEDDLKDFFFIDKIKNYDIYNLERFCIERPYKNPLMYIKKDNCTEETCDLLLKTFEKEMIEMYTKAKFTEFGAKLYNLFLQPNIKEVYIYVEEPINQIPYDCKTYFKEYENKMKFVSGDFIEVIKLLPIKPTMYILNDVDYIQQLIDNDFIGYTEILVGELGYNFEIKQNGDLQLKGNYEEKMQKHIFKLGYLPIINLQKKHFSCLSKKDFGLED